MAELPAAARSAGEPVGATVPGPHAVLDAEDGGVQRVPEDGLAEFELPPQALAITAMPAIAIIARARHEERFDRKVRVNSAWLPRMGELGAGAGDGRRRAVPGSGRPDHGTERGRRDREPRVN